MTTGTVQELANQIESKLSEIHKLRRDLRELHQKLRMEIERVERDEVESRHKKSVRWEEVEWDIHYIEVAIEGITNQVNTLKEHLYQLISVGPVRRFAFE